MAYRVDPAVRFSLTVSCDADGIGPRRLELIEDAVSPARVPQVCIVLGDDDADAAVARLRGARSWPDDGAHPVHIIRVRWGRPVRNKKRDWGAGSRVTPTARCRRSSASPKMLGKRTLARPNGLGRRRCRIGLACRRFRLSGCRCERAWARQSAWHDHPNADSPSTRMQWRSASIPMRPSGPQEGAAPPIVTAIDDAVPPRSNLTLATFRIARKSPPTPCV